MDDITDANISVAATFTALLNLVFCFFDGFGFPLPSVPPAHTPETFFSFFLFLYASDAALIDAFPAADCLQLPNSSLCASESFLYSGLLYHQNSTLVSVPLPPKVEETDAFFVFPSVFSTGSDFIKCFAVFSKSEPELFGSHLMDER